MLFMLVTLILLAALSALWLASYTMRQPAVRPAPVVVEIRRRRR